MNDLKISSIYIIIPSINNTGCAFQIGPFTVSNRPFFSCEIFQLLFGPKKLTDDMIRWKDILEYLKG